MTTRTLTITEFLLARIAEDEVEARNAAAAIGDGEWFGSPANLRRVFSVTLAEVARSAAPRHIARWDPARVLAECDAKRRIVILADFADEDGAWPVYLRALRALALPYADHPDYDESWRP